MIKEEPKLFHYVSKNHGLEIRAEMNEELWKEIKTISKELFIVGISSISWREIWKYGERGFRYSHLDVGHLLSSLIFSLKNQGWYYYILENISDDCIKEILCIEDIKDEVEVGEILMICSKTRIDHISLNKEWFKNIVKKVYGKSCKLSKGTHNWEIIESIRTSTIKKSYENYQYFPKIISYKRFDQNSVKSGKILRERRSALEYIEKDISLESFFEILKCSLPEYNPELFNHTSII